MSRCIRLVALCACLISLITRPTLSKSPDAVEILKQSYRSAPKACYSGKLKVTVYTGGRPATSTVNVYQDGRKSRMDYVSGPSAGKCILDDGKSVIRLNPPRKTAYVAKTPPAPEFLDTMLSNYKVVMAGSALVVGRDCYDIKLDPRNTSCVSRRLWIDKKSLVTLRMERCSGGRLESSTIYSSIRYSTHLSASLFTAPKGWKIVRVADKPETGGLDSLRKAVGFTPKKPGYVPKGYSFDDYYMRTPPDAKPLAGLRYTNGLNTISVFERKERYDAPGSCLTVDNPQMHLVHVQVGEIAVFIVGDIAESELKKMANSVK